ncbi:unnamed protein product [Lymnaea stagnalis]|uniref:C2H2-type domain-containing protein n=1 Tax=Lymnaea stagnalis TaxID=6523 RepID=A0AAV2IJ43_LYMST
MLLAAAHGVTCKGPEMPLDTFICGSCQDTFTDLNDFMFHKQKNCISGPAVPENQTMGIQSGAEIIQVHLNESGEITSMTSESMRERENKMHAGTPLAFLNDVNMESELARSDLDDGSMGDNPTTHLIILNRSLTGMGMKTEATNNGLHQESDQTLELTQSSDIPSPPKKRRPGRAKAGESKSKIIEAVPPTAPRPTVPETNPDGRLGCPQCKRTFTKERHFNTHKCLASSSYVDITKKEIVKIDSDEEDDWSDHELDAGARDDEGDDFTGPMDEDQDLEKEDEEDEKQMDKEEGTDHEKGSWKNKKRKKRKRSSYKFDIDVHEESSGAKQMKVAAEAMENVPIFKNEDEKLAFESCIDVDLSQVDNMFKIHIIEQELNDKTGTVYNTPTMSALSVYSCNICDKIFKSLSHIRLHCITHTDIKPFKCNKCKYATNSKGNLYTHMRKHTGQFYRCDHCEFKTVNKSHLVEHQMTHDNRRSQCILCHKDYSTLKSLINHIRKYHTDKKGKEYLQTFLQGRGVKGATVIHQCHICNRKFKKRLDRDRHLFIHDIKDLPNVQQCELCDYWASRRVYLDKHYLKHRVIYCCAVCDQKFLSTTRLSEHLTTMHIEIGDTGLFSADNLMEACISRSLYLPEPLGTTSEGSKYVNLPEELRENNQNTPTETEQTASYTQPTDEGNGQSQVASPNTATDDQSNDYVTEYRQFIIAPTNDGILSSQVVKVALSDDGVTQLEVNPTSDDMIHSFHSTGDGEDSVIGFDRDKSKSDQQSNSPSQLIKLETISHSPSLLMLQNPGSDSDGDDTLGVNNKENTIENDSVPMDEGSGDMDGSQMETMNDAVGDEEKRGNNELKEKEEVEDTPVSNVKVTVTKEEKIKALIKRLGYREMSMQIFNKMRETFGTEECEYCGRLFYSKVDYEPHLRTHTGDKPFSCDHCSFRATTKDQLKKHTEREHDITFQCRECDFLAPSRTRLWNHQLKHLGISGLACPSCPEKFDGMKQLRAHILNTHKDMDREALEKLTGYRHKPLGKMGRRSFKCPHCPRVFIRANSELQKHIWIHEGIKPFTCPICPYACRSKNNLQAHMLRHSTEKPFACSECGKEYKSKTALRWHVRSHKSGKLFKCDKCPYEATQSSHLKRHMEIHDVLKRFICKHCDFSANTLGYMKIHYAKNHKGQAFVHDEVVDPAAMSPEKRVYKCLSCGYLFGNMSDLKRHLKIRHHIQMQNFGSDQMTEVEVLQIENGGAGSETVLVSKTHQVDDEEIVAGELQLQVPNTDGSMSISANLLQQLIGMSQGGESQLRVVNEDGEPLNISFQHDGQMLVTSDANEMLPGNQYVIHYYNPGEMQSPGTAASESTSNTSIQLVAAGTHDQSQLSASEEPGEAHQYIITTADHLLTAEGQILATDGQAHFTGQEADSGQLITIDNNGHILTARNETGQFVGSDLDSYNCQMIVASQSGQAQNLMTGENSCEGGQDQLSSVAIADHSVN